MIKLWRLGPITGLWSVVRVCELATADQWLAIWKKDEPHVEFRLSNRKPKT